MLSLMALQVIPTNVSHLQVTVSRSHSLAWAICDPLRLTDLLLLDIPLSQLPGLQ